MTPGRMDPVSWYLLRIFETQPWDTRSWRDITQGLTPAAAISTILYLMCCGRGRPFMKTPPNWLTRPCPAKSKTKSLFYNCKNWTISKNKCKNKFYHFERFSFKMQQLFYVDDSFKWFSFHKKLRLLSNKYSNFFRTRRKTACALNYSEGLLKEHFPQKSRKNKPVKVKVCHATRHLNANNQSEG